MEWKTDSEKNISQFSLCCLHGQVCGSSRRHDKSLTDRWLKQHMFASLWLYPNTKQTNFYPQRDYNEEIWKERVYDYWSIKWCDSESPCMTRSASLTHYTNYWWWWYSDRSSARSLVVIASTRIGKMEAAAAVYQHLNDNTKTDALQKQQ